MYYFLLKNLTNHKIYNIQAKNKKLAKKKKEQFINSNQFDDFEIVAQGQE